ncbi:MAG: carboxypeptidase-like regulatory domain-containing protein [Bacteroidetes bacterium]|nr:carboxypeptidase-like regulatory domain-containing protein [Bacteroidota bacterium]
MKKSASHVLFFLPILLLPVLLHAQEYSNENLVQFSGITVTFDSLTSVPYARITIRNTNRGTTSDALGYFSFVAHKKDTILFHALGYKPASFIIPDTITKSRYSLIQLMTGDTLTLPAAIIFPWPTLEDFKRAFVNFKVPDDDLERARKNLDGDQIMVSAKNYPMDARMNYNSYIENQTSKLYYFGQQQPFTIFDPFAWARFIKAWRDGEFKRKKEKSTNNE